MRAPTDRIYIVGIRMLAGGSSHVHIHRLRWTSGLAAAEPHELPLGDLVAWIDCDGADVRVANLRGDARVVVVPGHPPHVRTVVDGVPTDDLLTLPRF